MKILLNKYTNKISIQTITFHEDIPNCYQVMGHTRTFGEKKKNQKVHNLKSNKRGNNDACAPQIILT